MQVESHPTNEEEDLGQMYSSKWIRYHLSMAVESTNSPLPKQYTVETFLNSLRKIKDYGKVP